jgi:hypothetical protein
MKTNKELNTEYDKKQQERVRPQGPTYNWKPLQDVIHQWIAGSK